MKIEITTLNAAIEPHSITADDPDRVPHVGLRFGNTPVASWPIPDADLWITDDAYGPDAESDYAERFVAEKLAGLFTNGSTR